MPSYAKSAILIFIALAASFTLAAPFPFPNESNQIDNTYAAQGGHASGGNINNSDSKGGLFGSGSLLRLFSGNAGSGGTADSVASPPVTHARVSELGSGVSGPGTDTGNNLDNSVGNAYSGPGGTSDGGSINSANVGLLDLFSGNAGGPGEASSKSGKIGIVEVPSPGRQRVTRFTRLRLDQRNHILSD